MFETCLPLCSARKGSRRLLEIFSAPLSKNSESSSLESCSLLLLGSLLDSSLLIESQKESLLLASLLESTFLNLAGA